MDIDFTVSSFKKETKDHRPLKISRMSDLSLLTERRYLDVDSTFLDIMDTRWTSKQRCVLTRVYRPDQLLTSLGNITS